MKRSLLFRKEDVRGVSVKRVPFSGKRLLGPLKSLFVSKEIPFCIIEDVEVCDVEAEAHKKDGDLFCVLGGEVEFICGGKLIEARVRNGSGGNELGGKGIRGGKTFKLRAGDWLWIPPGEPHSHRASFARMMVIKISNLPK